MKNWRITFGGSYTEVQAETIDQAIYFVWDKRYIITKIELIP